MDIQFLNPGVEYMIPIIMEFQRDGETAYWSDALYFHFPQIDREHAQSLPFEARCEYVGDVLRSVYAELEPTLEEKVRAYSERWAKYRGQITDAFSEAFGIDCAQLFNDLRCRISLNPVSPRFLQERCFDVFYLNSERGAVGIALHEMIHFVWFHVWNTRFGDSYEEYERPSLKWILSEMVVESIMRDERLSAINPYFPRENGGCVYSYFLDMMVEGRPVLETIDEMYRACDMPEFMERSYAYCLEHEKEIRAHIERAESSWA